MAEQGLREKPPLERLAERPAVRSQPHQGHDSLASLPRAILDLQRTAGNAAVSQLMIQRDDDHSVAAPAKSAYTADEHAKAIVAAAEADTPGIEERAVNAVTAIIDTYYSDKKSMVKQVEWWTEDKDGLMTTAQGKGPKVTGVIHVGKKFLESTRGPNFARHVLQVGHELEHIQQHRDGMGGKKKAPEREFLAFYHEGTATEIPHTGHMGPEMRIKLLNEAIANYNALSDDDKKKYEDQYKDLLEKKAGYEAKAKPQKTKGEGE